MEKEMTILKTKLIFHWMGLISVIFWTVLVISILIFGMNIEVTDIETDKTFFKFWIGGFFDHQE